MYRPLVSLFGVLAAGVLGAPVCHGQAVISTRSGLVHFFEGAVFVAGQPLEARPGRFATVPEGAELRTAQGRAEILLTPGVFLRLGEQSAVRMVASALQDTRVEFLAGSAIVDSGDPVAGTSVTLMYKGWNVHQAAKGVYRMDCDPPKLWVRDGDVQVTAAAGGNPITVEQGMDLPFADVLVPEPASGPSTDALSDWAEGRSESISADNSIAANIQDPADMQGLDPPADGFTYFPMLGLSSLGSSLGSPYGSMSSYSSLYGSPLYQAGFYSLYLPGYTYRPFFLRLPTTGVGLGLGRSIYAPSPYSPTRIGMPGTPGIRSPGIRPVTPAPRPLPGGVHVIHR